MKASSQIKQQGIFMYLYGALLYLYPRAYRVRFEKELLQIAQTTLSHGFEPQKTSPTIKWQVSWLIDLVFSAFREQRKEWEKNMNKKNLVSIFGSLLMIAWLAFVGLSVARDFFHLAYKEPMIWLIGETHGNLVFTLANGFVLLAPFIALLITGLPYLKWERSTQENQLAEIHLLKASGMSRVAIAISGVFSCLLLFLFLFGRML